MVLPCLCVQAILNFDLSHYQEILDDPDSYDPGALCALCALLCALCAEERLCCALRFECPSCRACACPLDGHIPSTRQPAVQAAPHHLP